METGDLSAWSAASIDGGDLGVTAQAAITGSYGLQAVVDDNNTLALTDWRPFEETRYRARFYFDPNAMSMAHNDAHYLLYGLNRDNIVIARIEFRFSAGDYQARAETINDNNSWSGSPWITLTDGPHAFEIDWRAASAAGANNGGLTFWVDGAQQANFTSLDNDTRRIDLVQIGVFGADNGTRGVTYFDAFETRRESYIGPAAGAPQPPAQPAKTDALFADGFEAGNLNAWSAAALDNGSLSVSAQAAITGSYGLQATINDNNSLYAVDWRPFEETHYRARFYFDPNSITMATGNAFYLFYALNRDGGLMADIELQYSAGGYQARAAAVNDSGGWSTSTWVALSDGPHRLEIDWRAATAAGANNGGLTLWVNGVQAASFSAIDNDTRKIDLAQIGAVAGIDPGTRGAIYFDAFETRRESYIGAARRPGKGGKVLAAPAPWQPLKLPAAVPAALATTTYTTTIAYTYDPLNRLKRANYSDGTSFAYTYDPVGNRLSEETAGGLVIGYAYDAANRLASVDGRAYVWDANGNLLSDWVNGYTYDHANRLVEAAGPIHTVSYAYNGQGERMRQTAGGVTTNYTVDLNAGLSQVLADGTYTYLYGNSRLAQSGASGVEYFLTDALGSVRQVVDEDGAVILSKDYRPYGEVLSSQGQGTTSYGFAGEFTSSLTGQSYLRARWYAPSQGRFTSRDTWQGEYQIPASYNRWLYGYANPINMIDPYGKAPFSHAAMLQYANMHDSKYPTFEDGYYAWGNDCTSFVSASLWAGGLRDPRHDPERLLPEKGAKDYPHSYWDKEKTKGNQPEFDHQQLRFFSWMQVDGLFQFLTNGPFTFASDEFTGTIPRFTYHAEYTDDNVNNDAWLNWLQKLQAGDIVQYHDGVIWAHTAIVVGLGPQTFNIANDSTSYNHPADIDCSCDPEICNFSQKPRVIDRNSPIKYTMSKSIDNTSRKISRIRFIHIPDTYNFFLPIYPPPYR